MIVMESVALAPLLLALAIGYLLGSVPFGLLLTRAAGTADLRAIGSGNIGATNVLRTGRKDLAAATLLLDALKATAAVWLAGRIAPELPAIGGLGAFLGHLYPVWLRFRGGKGVATFIGAALGIWWPSALVFAAVWLVVAVLTRYSSASALAATLVTPLALLAKGLTEAALILSVMTLLLWWRHRPNIAHLRAGTESRIGQAAPKGDAFHG